MNNGLEELEKLIRATNSALAEMKYGLLFNDWSEKFESKAEKNLFLQSYSGSLHSTSRYKAINKIRAVLDNVHGRWGKELAADTAKSKEILTGLMEEDMSKCVPVASKINVVERSPVIENLCNISPFQEKPMGREKNSVRKVKPAHEISGKADEGIKIKVEEAREVRNGIFKAATIESCQISNSENVGKRQNKTFRLEKTYYGSGTTSSRTKEAIGGSPGKATDELEKKSDGDGDNDNDGEGETKKKLSNGRKGEKNGAVGFASERREKKRFSRLELQLLPSLHISAKMQVQKIHRLEIMPATVCAMPNTATDLLSHEQIEKDKKNKIFEDEGKEEGVSCRIGAECFYCRKLMEAQKKKVRPEEIDKILAKCHYNIFHPQIEEFVRSCDRKETKSCVADHEKSEDEFWTGTFGADSSPARRHSADNEVEKRLEKPWSTAKQFNLNELSVKVSKKFQTKSLKLDERRLRLETIFRKLYKKINESNEYLTYCTLKSNAEMRKQYFKRKEIPRIVWRSASEADFSVSTVECRGSSARSHILDSMVEESRDQLEEEGKFAHLNYPDSVKNDRKREKYQQNLQATDFPCSVNVKKVNYDEECSADEKQDKSRKNRKRWFVENSVVNFGFLETSMHDSASQTSYGCDDDFEKDSSSLVKKTSRIAKGESGRTGTFDVVSGFPEKMYKIGTRSSYREEKRIWTTSNKCDTKSGRFDAGEMPTDAAPAHPRAFSPSTSHADPSSNTSEVFTECRPNGILARTHFSRSVLAQLRPGKTSAAFDGCLLSFSSKETTTAFGDILSALSERFVEGRSTRDRLSENDREFPGNEGQSREGDRRSAAAGRNKKMYNLRGAGAILQTSTPECLADTKEKSGVPGRSSPTPSLPEPVAGASPAKENAVGAEGADVEVRPFASDRCRASNKRTAFLKNFRREAEADNWLSLKVFKKADLSRSEGEIDESDVSDAADTRSFRSLGEIPSENTSVSSASARWPSSSGSSKEWGREKTGSEG